MDFDNFDVLKTLCIDFWNDIQKSKELIEEHLQTRDPIIYQQIVNIVNITKYKYNITDRIGLYFGIDVRNGLQLSERNGSIELILSPLMQRNNITLLNMLYDEVIKNDIFANWVIIKYKFWQPFQFDRLSIKCDNIDITQSDFEYYPMIDETTNKLSIILFIRDEIHSHLIKKENVNISGNERCIWIPININVYTILDGAIGEYNLLNILDKMEIYLKSEYPEIERFNLEHFTKNIQKINNNPLSKLVKCSRCHYSNKQTKLKVCKCKKVYYCDAICQLANRYIHKLSCSINT